MEKKKKFLAEYKHQQKKEFEVGLPKPRMIFLDLFDFLDQKLESLTYLADFSLTRFFLKGRDLEVEVILGFLEANGAYCELLYNVADLF
ncbi:DUF2695 domain-containing protein [Streptococcus sp. LPB0406]|nr:DUF2695 domain-containing protein [Streptococcus sp. LPB0406]